MNDPPIYHITHVDNLPNIISEGGLWCDAQRIARQIATTNIGLSNIKARRLRHPVRVAAGGFVGDYVPFNFCPRSVMLWRISRGHDYYSEGQRPVVHLVTSIGAIRALGCRWFFTDGHADMRFPGQFDDLDRLDEVDWTVMPTDFWWGGNDEARHRKQAEFLVHDFCPWPAIENLAVLDADMARMVQEAIRGATHQPQVTVRPDWYY